MLEIIFIFITLLSCILFYCGTGEHKRVVFSSLAWLLLTGSIAGSGYFENVKAMPPRFLLVLLGAAGGSFYLYQTLKASKITAHYLVAVHTLRLPVELVIFELYLRKQMPVLMTLKGWNFDIVIGISAILLLLYLILTKRKFNSCFARAWNIAGLASLTFTVVIAILSYPVPIQQFGFEQPNTAVLKFPFVFLPAYIVPVVFLSHILLIKSKTTE